VGALLLLGQEARRRPEEERNPQAEGTASLSDLAAPVARAAWFGGKRGTFHNAKFEIKAGEPLQRSISHIRRQERSLPAEGRSACLC